jgi:hypothetical protein
MEMRKESESRLGSDESIVVCAIAGFCSTAVFPSGCFYLMRTFCHSWCVRLGAGQDRLFIQVGEAASARWRTSSAQAITYPLSSLELPTTAHITPSVRQG